MTQKPICILSLDGGGIMGLVSLHVLKDLERRTQRPISSLFQFIAGVSTGGLIALGLTCPALHTQDPRYSAADIIHLYKTRGRNIFTPQMPWWHTIHDLFFARYSSHNALRIYDHVFQQTLFSQALSHLFIPAYNLHHHHKGPRLKIFNSHRARAKNTPYDFFMKEIALATSAAPTYFAPQKIKRFFKTGHHTLSGLVDGAVAINDPALLIYLYVRSIYPRAPLLLLSIGSGEDLYGYQSILEKTSPGKWAWHNALQQLIVHPQISVYRHVLEHLLQKDQTHAEYVRIQFAFEQHVMDFDHITPQSIAYLENIASTLIKRESKSLAALAQQLISHESV